MPKRTILQQTKRAWKMEEEGRGRGKEKEEKNGMGTSLVH